MEETGLINWDYFDDNKMTGSYDIFYVLIRKTRNTKPYELRIFKNGDIWVFTSFALVPSAVKCAEELVLKFYKLKETMKKRDTKEIPNNIIYIKKWRETHGSKE